MWEGIVLAYELISIEWPELLDKNAMYKACGILTAFLFTLVSILLIISVQKLVSTLKTSL